MGTRFTVVIPNRNGGDLFRLCFQSVLEQGYPEFDVVVLDNDSSDGTREWAERLGDPRVRIVPSDTALSIEGNWARILALPRAEFMTIVGADDLLDPSFLMSMSSLIRSFPDAALYQSGFRLIDETGALLRSCRILPSEEDGPAFLRARLRRERDSFGTGYVMRTAAYDEAGGIPPFDGLLFADDALWLRLLRQGHKRADPDERFAYRLHIGSASGAPRGTLLLGALAQYLDFLFDLAAENPAIRAVLAADLEPFIQREVQNWYLNQLTSASRSQARGIARQQAMAMLHTLHPRLSAAFTELRRSDKTLWIHEAINVVPAARRLYAWRARWRAGLAPEPE